MAEFLKFCWAFLKALGPPKPQPIPQVTFTTPPKPITVIKYQWDTRNSAKHSCRLIMDEHGLAWKEKDLLCAVIEAESGFKINAVNHNTDGTSDYGICQINTRYWIGPGKYFSSKEEVFEKPEKSVRFMCEKYRAGHLHYWAAYQNKSYLKFL